MILIQLLNRYTHTITVNRYKGKNKLKRLKKKKIFKVRLHAKLITIRYNKYLCSNSILENGHQHNGPQFRVQLEATYEFFFSMLFS